MKLILILLYLSVIKIDVKPIYENAKFPYNIVNLLHHKTRKSKVKKLLFFNENNKDSFLLRESERRLRSLGIFKYAEIKTSSDTDTVYVNLKDLFTFSLFLSLQGGGGRTRFSAGVEEHNFFGRAIDAGVFYVKSYERDYLSLLYIEPSFLNSPMDIYFSLSSAKKYQIIDFYFKRPFYTFLKNYPYLNYSKIKKLKYIYEEGEKVDSTDFLDEKLEAGFLKNLSRKEWNAFGLEFEARRRNKDEYFSLNAVYVFGREKYLKERFIRNFGEIEDIFTGWKVNFKVKTDFKEQGIETSFSFGFKIFKTISGFSGYFEDYYYRNFSLSFLTFIPVIKRVTIANRILYSKPYENIFLGGTNGLRGYPAYYLETEEYILNTSEIRIFGPEILKVFAPGMVFFIDFAKIMERKKIFYDFGIGFRGEFTRNFNLPVVRFDIAFKSPYSKAVYSFGEGQTF